LNTWSYSRTSGIALAATFAALISVTSWIEIPLKWITPVPITFQVFVVYLTVALLGPRYGAVSMIAYLLLGAMGLPVFAGFSSGTATLFGPTGGYLFAFPIANLVGGQIALKRATTRRRDTFRVTVSALVALALIYGIGVLWLSYYLHISFIAGLLAGAVPFIPLDLLKGVIAVPIAVRIRWSNLRLPIKRSGSEDTLQASEKS
jgi:biotin transport system substrate-specific component